MTATRSDVFLSHQSRDKRAVEELARKLLTAGITPWLDIWNLVPGVPWQEEIEKALDSCSTCAVFVGPSGSGPWQNEEMRAAIQRRVTSGTGAFRVIPVLLPGASLELKDKLPSLLTRHTWVEFDGLDDETAFHRLISGIQGREPGPGTTAGVRDDRCPYRGLQVFDVDDSEFFFGREALVTRVLTAMQSTSGSRQELRFVSVLGPSGSGKSSVVRAGVIAALKRNAIPGSDAWPIVILRPGVDPIESLAVALADQAGPSDGVRHVRNLMSSFREDDSALHLSVRLALRQHSPADRMLVVIDQFEEAFTRCQNEATRAAFFRNLLYAAGTAEGQCTALITMRADFYGRCAAYNDLAIAMTQRQFLVGPMLRAELRMAIEAPAHRMGCELEPGLAEVLVDEANNQAGALPLLQHALMELWKHRVGHRMTHDAYDRIGRLSGALEKRAEELYQHLTDEQKELCRNLFLRLIQQGVGSEPTKRRVSLRELTSVASRRTEIEELVGRLAAPDARLLTVQTEGGPESEPVGEMSHEALIKSWARLRGWIEEDRENIRIQSRLAEATREWIANDRNEAFLYRGARLAQASEWAHTYASRVNAEEQGFLAGSLDLAAEDLRISDASALDQLQLSAPAVWNDSSAMTDWLARAEPLVRRIENHERQLERLRREAIVSNAQSGAAGWVFGNSDRQFEHDTLATFVLRMARFRDSLFAAAQHVAQVRPQRRALSIDQHSSTWAEAIAAIATDGETYGHLTVAPQEGLVPLGPDRQSGLWEFAHLLTGTVPRREPTGRLSTDESTAIILVLVPGGTFRMGAARPAAGNPEGSPNCDPYALDEEGPVHDVRLAPFFISKHQMTQGQWLRATGANPSMFRPEPANDVTLLHPVECVSWHDCMDALTAVGLTLPTEAQWEYAARAGTTTIWWTGNAPGALREKANLMRASHLPVGCLDAPNPFGLHDVVGNVWEWCRDRFGFYPEGIRGDDACREGEDTLYLSRGGSFFNTEPFARSAIRYFKTVPEARFNNLGMRAARPLTDIARLHR